MSIEVLVALVSFLVMVASWTKLPGEARVERAVVRRSEAAARATGPSLA